MSMEDVVKWKTDQNRDVFISVRDVVSCYNVIMKNTDMEAGWMDMRMRRYKPCDAEIIAGRIKDKMGEKWKVTEMERGF